MTIQINEEDNLIIQETVEPKNDTEKPAKEINNTIIA